MLIVLCSAKGSPGSTTAALALAAGWPEPNAVVIEADPAGGDLGIRLRGRDGALPPTPTVATLASSARQGKVDPSAVAIPLNDQVRVVPGFASPEAGLGMASLWEPLAAGLRSSSADCLVDIGQVRSTSQTMALIEAADVVVVALRPTVTSLVHTRSRIAQLASGRQRVIVPLVVSRERDSAADRAEINEVLAADNLLGVQPTQRIALDPTAVQALQDGTPPSSWQLVRSRLIRSAQATAAELIEHRASGLIGEAL